MLIGELAARSAVTIKAIRTYEVRGLIAPVARAANGYRYFDAGLAKVVPVFANMLAVGLELREVRAIFAPGEPLRSCPSDAALRASMVRAVPIYQRQIEAVDSRLADLAGRRRALEVRLERCRNELQATGLVELPPPRVGRRRLRPGRVEYELALHPTLPSGTREEAF